MKKTNLVELMQRYITGQVSQQEKAKIEAWLDLKKTEGADMDLDEENEERLFRKITANLDNVNEIRNFKPESARPRPLYTKPWIRIAASLLLVAVASVLLWRLAFQNDIQETIALHTPQKTILSDGTIVWLKESSRLMYVERKGLRLASLEGEGLFEVAKNPSSPFIISCGDLKVKVVGTSFNLKTDTTGTELKVLTGRVQLSSPSDPIGVEVVPNEMAVYNHGEIKKVAITQQELRAVTANTEYDMTFRNVSLTNVARKIEKKFDVEIAFDDAHAGDCRITADFTDHSLESTLQMITELLEIDFRIDKRTITITGNGCN